MLQLLPLAAAIALLVPGKALGQTKTQGDMPAGDHRHHDHKHHSGEDKPPHEDHAGHSHDVGPAGATDDLRFLDGMVQHHTGALRMSEFVFDIGSPGVGALGKAIWHDQAREIKAMGLWRRAWYPDAPVYPVMLRDGGDPDAMADLVRMSEAEKLAMQMMSSTPTRDNRVVWFLEGMLFHHCGAVEMAHDSLEKSSNTTIRRLARQIIVAQRQEIIQLRRMLALKGLRKPQYHKFDSLFPL